MRIKRIIAVTLFGLAALPVSAQNILSNPGLCAADDGEQELAGVAYLSATSVEAHWRACSWPGRGALADCGERAGARHHRGNGRQHRIARLLFPVQSLGLQRLEISCFALLSTGGLTLPDKPHN